jgi:hypothetical protein
MTQQEAIEKLNIRVDLIPAGASNRPGTKITPTHVTIHNTANSSPGANAAMHAQYVKGPDARKREVSWHFTVDDRQVYKHLPTNEKGWHAGSGNSKSIGIEVCEHQGIDQAAAIDRAALLTALMMLAYGIPRERVVSHYSWTQKNCPRVILHGPGGFDAFRDRAANYLAQLKATTLAGVAPEAALPSPGMHQLDFGPTGSAVSTFSEMVDLEDAAATVAPVGPGSAADEQGRIAELERLIGRLVVENHRLRQELEQTRDTAQDLGREAD